MAKRYGHAQGTNQNTPQTNYQKDFMSCRRKRKHWGQISFGT